MPHCHSPESIRRRRLRAAKLGYLKQKKINDCRAAAIDDASGSIGTASRGVASEDPWLHSDPWSAAASLLTRPTAIEIADVPAVSVPQPLEGCVSSSGRHLLAEYCNELEAKVGKLEAHIALNEKLLADSNSTIALLMGTIENFKMSLSHVHSHDDHAGVSMIPLDGSSFQAQVDSCVAQCKASHAAVTKLAASMKDCIEQSLDKRSSVYVTKDQLAEFGSTFVNAALQGLEKRFYQLLRPHIDDLIVPLVCKSITTLSDDLTGKISEVHVPDLLRNYDARIQKQFGEIKARDKDKCEPSKSHLQNATWDCDDELDGADYTMSNEKIALGGCHSTHDIHVARGGFSHAGTDVLDQTALREMPMNVFLEVVADVQRRLPHLVEPIPSPLKLCYGPLDDVQSDVTSELPSSSECDFISPSYSTKNVFEEQPRNEVAHLLASDRWRQ